MSRLSNDSLPRAESPIKEPSSSARDYALKSSSFNAGTTEQQSLLNTYKAKLPDFLRASAYKSLTANNLKRLRYIELEKLKKEMESQEEDEVKEEYRALIRTINQKYRHQLTNILKKKNRTFRMPKWLLQECGDKPRKALQKLLGVGFNSSIIKWLGRYRKMGATMEEALATIKHKKLSGAEQYPTLPKFDPRRFHWSRPRDGTQAGKTNCPIVQSNLIPLAKQETTKITKPELESPAGSNLSFASEGSCCSNSSDGYSEWERLVQSVESHFNPTSALRGSSFADYYHNETSQPFSYHNGDDRNQLYKQNDAELESNFIGNNQPSEGIQVVVLPKIYPQISLDTAALMSLEEALVEEIAYGWRDKLQFEDSCHKNGRLMLFCASIATVQWIFETVNKFRSGSGIELRAVLGDYTPDALRISLFLPDSLDQPLEKSLAFLATQNAGVDINAWTLIGRRDEESGQLLMFEVDQGSMDAIKRNNNTLYYRFGTINVMEGGYRIY